MPPSGRPLTASARARPDQIVPLAPLSHDAGGHAARELARRDHRDHEHEEGGDAGRDEDAALHDRVSGRG